MHMQRKGQIRWWKKGDIRGQARFVNRLFGWPRDAFDSPSQYRKLLINP